MDRSTSKKPLVKCKTSSTTRRRSTDLQQQLDSHKRETNPHNFGAVLKSARDIMRKDKGLNGDLDRLPMLTWIMFLKFLDDQEKVLEAEAMLSSQKFRPTIGEPYRWRDWASKEDGITGPELIAFINQDEAVLP